MQVYQFFLKNMVSNSCVRLIKLYFEAYESIQIQQIELGCVRLKILKPEIKRNDLVHHFESIGFGVLEDKDEILVEEIKTAAIELIHLATNSNSLIRNSLYISERVQESYDKISKTFSKVTGTTIEKYIILLKIEKVKMLLLEDDYSLSEISYQLGYSSVQYLSRQFKATTGYTVTDFCKLEEPLRIPLEDII